MQYSCRQIHPSVFRAYDIRGRIGLELDESAFYTIGLALGTRLHALKRSGVFLGRDARLTSLALSAALKQGILDTGIDVIDLRAVATPVIYFATHAYGLDSGVMITGSHNPADYNGIKMVLAGKTLMQADIDILYQLIIKNNFRSGKGQALFQDAMPDYIDRIVSDISLKRPLKVVVDCGNGIAGATIPNVLEQLGCEVIPLFCEVDGNFPHHHPDPAVESNLADLKACVLAEKADIGLAFDGDADRLGVLTNQGKIIWPDRLMMLYAKDLLITHPGATIIFDVKCSSLLAEVIKKAQGIPVMCPTGHSIIKGVMKEKNALIAGEMSGHLFFKDRWYGFDDALYGACRLLEIMSASEKTLEEQFDSIPDSVNTPEIKIPISDEEKFLLIDTLKNQARFENASMITIDGLRVEFEKGWGLLRASNTTPCLVARFEAQDLENLQQIQALFKQELLKINSEWELPF